MTSPEPTADLRSLLLAFAWHMAREVMAADDHTDDREQAFLDRTFPPELLRAAGLRDDAGADTDWFVELRERALVELPDRLTLGEKLELLEGLIDAVAADGALHPAELAVLGAAAGMLGVDEADWRPLVTELVESGRL